MRAGLTLKDSISPASLALFSSSEKEGCGAASGSGVAIDTWGALATAGGGPMIVIGAGSWNSA